MTIAVDVKIHCKTWTVKAKLPSLVMQKVVFLFPTRKICKEISIFWPERLGELGKQITSRSLL